ncbi:unnamed protein product [Bemisia tabaci]|uniref:Glycoprotein n=1 Tax=Bemisia tabaci TaxID=7038 RepID=A0A9P0A011_BEMTA|nr:unnamed protein product [Bemisia tabaci]
MISLFLCTLLALTQVTLALEPASLTGFDCVSQPIRQTEISLKNIKECNGSIETTTNTTTIIQVVQQNEEMPIRVISCKTEILRIAHRCSMWGDLQSVPNSLSTYYPDLTMSQCHSLIKDRAATDYGKMVDLTMNGETIRTTLLAGEIKPKGGCIGGSYSDGTYNHDDVVVQATIKFTLYDSEAMFNPTLNEIYLKTGVKCVYSAGKCFDPDRGYTFWEPEIQDKCDAKHYTVLYEGPATRFNDSTAADPISYLVNENDVAFCLTAIKRTTSRICHHEAFQTEHSRFFVLPKTEYEFPFYKNSKNVTADILTYFNVKFVFLDKHIKSSLSQLYTQLRSAACQLERQILEHHLTLAIHHGDDFAWIRGGGPGYMTITMGEVAYLLQCLAVPVTLRQTDSSYNEIPVYYQNETKFLIPRTRILTSKGTEVDCSPNMPVKFEINGRWRTFTPRIMPADPPTELTSQLAIDWKYTSPDSLFQAGIYTLEYSKTNNLPS